MCCKVYCIPYTAEFRTHIFCHYREVRPFCVLDYRALRCRSMHYLHCIHGSALHSGSCHTISTLWIGMMSARGHNHDESLGMSTVYQLLFHLSGEVSHINRHLNRPARANYIFTLSHHSTCMSIIPVCLRRRGGTGFIRLPHQLPALLSLISESRHLREPPWLIFFTQACILWNHRLYAPYGWISDDFWRVLPCDNYVPSMRWILPQAPV